MIEPATESSRDGRGAAPWTLVLPVAYGVHLLEEWYGGEGILEWTARLTGEPMAETVFFLLNGLTLPLFVITTVLAVAFRPLRWIPISWGALLLVNGVLHALGALATASYFPGIVSGLSLYVPLGVMALRDGRRRESRSTFRWAVALGVGYHVLVSAIAL